MNSLSSWSTWLTGSNDAKTDDNVQQNITSDESPSEINATESRNDNADVLNMEELSANAVNSAKELGNLLFGFASTASKEIGKTVKVVQSKIDYENSIIGDFSREQLRFEESKLPERHTEAAVPPWLGYNEEEEMRNEILSLSTDERNLLRAPPSASEFSFDLRTSAPVAMVMLKEDPRLQKLRFRLVPKMITEGQFWHNYFYRVSLVKQSSQLSTLAHQSRELPDYPPTSPPRTPPTPIVITPISSTTKEDLEAAPPASPDFASEDVSCNVLTNEEIMEDQRNLGIVDPGPERNDNLDDEWENELQNLGEYEVVAPGNDRNWEEDLDEMLKDE